MEICKTNLYTYIPHQNIKVILHLVQIYILFNNHFILFLQREKKLRYILIFVS